MVYKWPTVGIASQEAIDAEASPETQKAIKEETAVQPLTTADVAPKKGRKAAKKATAKSGKKKAK